MEGVEGEGRGPVELSGARGDAEELPGGREDMEGERVLDGRERRVSNGRPAPRLRQRQSRWTPAKYLLTNASVFFSMATLSGGVKDSESPLLEWNRLSSWTAPAVVLWPAMTRICGFKKRSAMGFGTGKRLGQKESPI